MATIACNVDINTSALSLEQQYPIMQREHNMTRIEFQRRLDEYDEDSSTIVWPSLMFRTPRDEELTFIPSGYQVTQHDGALPVTTESTEESDIEISPASEDDTDETTEGWTETETDAETSTSSETETDPSLEPQADGDETDPSSGDETEPGTDEGTTYWLEQYWFDIPRILTEWPGKLTMALCYLWLDTTNVDGVEQRVVTREWNSSTVTLDITETFHTSDVINKFTPNYMLEYDESGKVLYLVEDQS